MTGTANAPADRSAVAYQEAVRDYRIVSARACAVVVIVLILLGSVLDFLVYPELMERFAWARAGACLFIALACALTHLGFGKRHTQTITFVWLLTPQVMICWMIWSTQGEQSWFYAGLLLSVFSIGSLFPVGWRTTMCYGVATLALYAAACSMRPGGVADVGQFAFHQSIVAFAVGGSATFSYFNERGRYQLFQLREQVALKNLELAEINANLIEIKGQMLQQEKMAAIGVLAAGLLHEVNNPVNFCLMAIEIAREEPEAATNVSLRECLDDAREGMQRIQSIVSDLKTFAHRKPGATVPDAPFLLQKALDSAIRLTSHELGSIAVTQTLPVDTLVRGDEAAVIGVVINLMSNAALALKKIQRTDPAIDVTAEWRSDRLHVGVRDNGAGITAEHINRVFEPFFTTRAVGQGLGLGLSISYRVIEQHGGTLVAASEAGHWTKMTFDLPRG